MAHPPSPTTPRTPKKLGKKKRRKETSRKGRGEKLKVQHADTITVTKVKRNAPELKLVKYSYSS